VFRENESYTFSVAVSPDSRTFLTGSMDNTARLWDLQGNVIQVFKGQEGYITSLAFSPDGKSILTGSFDETARLWEIREPLKEFQKKNLYQELSVKQKLRYGILELKDILKLNDKKLIYETAEYYNEGRNLVGKDMKTEYLNNAELLFHKGLDLDTTVHGLFALRLTEICIEKNQLNQEDIKKEIDKYFDILSKTDDINDLIISLEFYAARIDSTTAQYGYSDKAIYIAEKLKELSLNDRYIRSQLSLDCNNLSYYSIGSKQFKNSLTAIKIAIEADSTFQLSYSNLPLAYLFNNMYNEAESEYRKWKDTPWTIDSRFKTFREVFLADISDLESRGIVNPGFAKIKVLLKK
jgi:WD40 repeat protein